MDGQNAVLNFRPLISVRAERVAEVLGVTIEEANQLLSQPETRAIVERAINDALHAGVDTALVQMARIPLVSVSGNVRDCAVALPALPQMVSMVG